MPQGFMKKVYSVIDSADVLVMVLDSRFPELTRNREFEHKILRKGKKLIFTINKSDLGAKEQLEKAKNELLKVAPTIFVSAKKHTGATMIKAEIGKAISAIERKEKNNEEKKTGFYVGVLGYPNTGKSSIINMLAGRRAARTSPTAGFTRGEQKIRISERVMLIDTPGIIPYDLRDENELALVGSKNANQVKDVEGVAEYLVDYLEKNLPNAIEKTYGIETHGKDPEEILGEIAIKKKKMRKGGIADTAVISRMLIADWQSGKIRA